MTAAAIAAAAAPLTAGVHHVGLAVPDLEAARDFFCGLLGWHETGRNDGYPMLAVSDGQVRLTLWRVADPGTAVGFDRRTNIGLHHLALAVADAAALADVHERARHHPGVSVQFPPSPMRPDSPLSHFICTMPGGIRIEFATRA